MLEREPWGELEGMRKKGKLRLSPMESMHWAQGWFNVRPVGNLGRVFSLRVNNNAGCSRKNTQLEGDKGGYLHST